MTARRVRLVAGVLAVAALAAGCGSSSPSSSGSQSAAQTAKQTSGAATVKAMNIVGYGKVLTAHGHPVYVLSSDPAGASSCTGSCAKQWPPVTVHGAPTAGPGVNASMVSTFKRSDGRQQVLYNKQALYTHKGRGLLSGAGLSSNGGTWYLVSPKGNAIKSTSTGGY